ncbi:MaoC family dehydratase N-terminal domain-containing protein [Rhizorhabdus wittichii]|uniref:MaoC family dehydratase N-terminal domain-containing protein n=2 Tax=Rhizorhabdus wittichii TaxID=160791 RepID=A0A975D1M5_9SPHN|nr:MaoC family dehydratase N-terminal domain-containing protein [Rhizorhabdus wittichii]
MMAEADPITGKITDEDIERARRQIGVPKFAYNKPYNAIASSDGMSHFAFACGDANPLYHDRAYGAGTRWRDQIAPPLFLHATGTNLTPKPDAETKALFKGLFRGVGKYYTGVDWTWWRPIYPDERVFVERSTSNIQVKESSSFSGGRTVTETYRDLYVDRAGTPVGRREEHYLSAEREGTKKAGRYAAIQRQSYTPDDIARIDEVYAAEVRRGASPRFWEDVEVGEELVPVAKGPLTMVDIIAFHMGMGLSSSGIGPLGLGYAQRRKMPAFYVPDAYGVPDVVQRVHWDHERAQALGLPTSYDYGQMRTSWLIHLATNWMGDDAWLWKLSCQSRAFNFMGDTTICTGRVVAKRIEGAHAVVDLELASTNQRGENTAPGSASVILPSRAHGPVVLPTPEADTLLRGAAIVQSAADRTRK